MDNVKSNVSIPKTLILSKYLSDESKVLYCKLVAYSFHQDYYDSLKENPIEHLADSSNMTYESCMESLKQLCLLLWVRVKNVSDENKYIFTVSSNDEECEKEIGSAAQSLRLLKRLSQLPRTLYAERQRFSDEFFRKKMELLFDGVN